MASGSINTETTVRNAAESIQQSKEHIQPNESRTIQNSTSQQKNTIQNGSSQHVRPSVPDEGGPESQSSINSNTTPNPIPQAPINVHPESCIVYTIPTPLPQPGGKDAPMFRGNNFMSFERQYRRMILRHDTPDRKAAALVEDYCSGDTAFEVQDLYAENMSLRELFEAMKNVFASMDQDRLLASPRCLKSFVNRWIQLPESEYTLEGYLLNFKALVSRARQFGFAYDESTKGYELLRGLQRVPEVQKIVCKELSIIDPILPGRECYRQIVSFLENERRMDDVLAMLNCTDFSSVHPHFEVR